MKHEQRKPSPVAEGALSEVVDPVCGMRIAREDAIGTHVHEGTTYYFCSAKCLEDFRANPTQYTQPPEARTSTASAPASGGAAEYTCPMHPEIVRNEPGSCPICGMALEPVW